MTNPSKYMYHVYVNWTGDGPRHSHKKFSTYAKATEYIDDFHKKENYFPDWKVVKELREVID